jgi:hypothetical protein
LWGLKVRCVSFGGGIVWTVVSFLSASFFFRFVVLGYFFSLVPDGLSSFVRKGSVVSYVVSSSFIFLVGSMVEKMSYLGLIVSLFEAVAGLQGYLAVCSMKVFPEFSVRVGFNLWLILWLFLSPGSLFLRLFPLCFFLIGLVRLEGLGQVLEERADVSKYGNVAVCDALLGGFRPGRVVGEAIDKVLKADSEDVGWPSVRLSALRGDRLLKFFLVYYVESKGGTVADASVLEQLLQNDAAFGRVMQARCMGWWASTPVHMRGKAAATVLEGVWGCASSSLLVEGVVPSSLLFFEEFTRVVARVNGFLLDGCKLVPLDSSDVFLDVSSGSDGVETPGSCVNG